MEPIKCKIQQERLLISIKGVVKINIYLLICDVFEAYVGRNRS